MQKKGFTLIELMIVVAIIAILAMIAVPMYQRYIEKSRNAAASSLIQQLALAEAASQTEAVGKTFTAAELANVNADGYVTVDALADTGPVEWLTNYGFRPDPNVGFAVYPPAAAGVSGFVALAANRAPGSVVYIYDNINGTGAEVYSNATVYANGAANSTPTNLFIFDFNGSAAAGSRVTASTVVPGGGTAGTVTFNAATARTN